MATTLQPSFRAAATVTVTVAALANQTLRQAAAVDNHTNKDLNGYVSVKLKSGASGVSATGFANVFITKSIDGGTTYDEGGSGTDAAFTPYTPSGLQSIGQVPLTANAATFQESFFVTDLPEYFQVVIDNESGAALDATAGNHAVKFQGVSYTNT